MKITHVPGYGWPISITCDTCGITYEVDSPADLLRHTKYSYKHKDGIAIPNLERKYVTAPCPCCGKEHELQDAQIPIVISKGIPLAPGEAAFCS